jgi:uncharacterized protein GlcG (DUF336 family)
MNALRDWTVCGTLLLAMAGASAPAAENASAAGNGVAMAAVRGVTLAEASRIVDAALVEARKGKLRPMTVLVLDGGGDLVAFKREDHTGIGRYNIAVAKAYGALVMNRPSRTIGEIAAAGGQLFVESLMASTGGRVNPSPGGVLIKNAEGMIIGAVGSSGDESYNDEAIAIAGVKAAGLLPEPAEPARPTVQTPPAR